MLSHKDWFLVFLSLLSLAELKDCSVTWGMKNTPPLAAVENIGQYTTVWTSVQRTSDVSKTMKANAAVTLVHWLI